MNVSLMFIFSGNFQFETGLFSFYLIVNKRTLCCCLVEMSHNVTSANWSLVNEKQIGQ